MTRVDWGRGPSRKPRWYDPAIGRWGGVDPLAESFYSFSPYSYVYSNPVRFTDPDGRAPEDCCGPGAVTRGGSIALRLLKGARTADKARRATSASELLSSEVASIKHDINTLAFSQTATFEDAVAATSDLVLGTSFNEDETGTFGGEGDTNSETEKEAYGKAKEANGIPRSKQPERTIKPDTPEGRKAGLDSRNVRQDEFINSKGEKISIRKDKPARYNDGGKGDQGPHFNGGKSGEKLKNHHFYKE